MRHSTKKKNVSFDNKRAIIEMLSKESQEGKSLKGVVSKVANVFSICRKSTSQIWRDVKHSNANDNLPDLSLKLLIELVGKKIQVDF